MKSDSAPGSRQVQLWQFILELLNTPKYNDSISWNGNQSVSNLTKLIQLFFHNPTPHRVCSIEKKIFRTER